MAEVNLMDLYPRSTRNLQERSQASESDAELARQFGQEYFDGTRDQGYGGYSYNARFWQATAERFRDHYELSDDALILDVGCAKGYMLHDLHELMPQATVAGIDISEYAIENAIEDMKPHLQVGNATELPYQDDAFDLVISINSIHNLPEDDCFRAVQEIERVSRKNSFIVVDSYRNEHEKTQMELWNLTAKTYFETEGWMRFFDRAGYTGDCWWFIAE